MFNPGRASFSKQQINVLNISTCLFEKACTKNIGLIHPLFQILPVIVMMMMKMMSHQQSIQYFLMKSSERLFTSQLVKKVEALWALRGKTIFALKFLAWAQKRFMVTWAVEWQKERPALKIRQSLISESRSVTHLTGTEVTVHISYEWLFSCECCSEKRVKWAGGYPGQVKMQKKEVLASQQEAA